MRCLRPLHRIFTLRPLLSMLLGRTMAVSTGFLRYGWYLTNVLRFRDSQCCEMGVC